MINIINLAATRFLAQRSELVPFNWPTINVTSAKLSDILATVGSALALLTGSISVIVLIAAGIMYMVSAGSEELVTKAKNMIKYAITGIVVAVVAYALVTFVINTILRGA
jgi:hypothetical protein